MNKLLRKMAAPTALVVGMAAGATALEVARDPIADLGAQTLAARPPASGESLATAFRTASKTAMPGVVYVGVESAPRNVSRQMPDMFQGTPFEDFFGGGGGGPQPQMRARPSLSSGSGFIISPDGYILTNNHVVEDASRVTVQLTDKREFQAKVVGRDPNTDVAVLKIDATGLPTVQLGSSDALDVGDWVLALGYPLSLGETVTAGIVSAKGRSIGIIGQGDKDANPVEHFIQTDAAINPGNSGGPLIDLQGRVIGINSAIASPTGTYAGYGFAVPIQLAKRVADDLIKYGAVRRPKLGVSIKNVTSADVDVFKLPNAQGAVVAGVPAGPAKEAGIELGDVIVAVNGDPIEDTGDLMERVALLQPGQTARLDVIRYGKREGIDIRLGSFEAERAPRTTSADEAPDALGKLGFAAQELTPEIAQQLRLSRAEGVVVTQVDPMGPAAGSVGRGMVIERLNGKEIRSTADLRAAAAGLKPGQTVSLLGWVDGTQTIANFKLRQ